MTNKEFEDALVAVGWTPADAQKKVAELTAAIGQRFVDATEETRTKTLRNAIRTMTKSKVEKIMGLCLGFTRLQDSNNFDRRKALEIYAQDPQRAAQEHYVVMVNATTGKVVLPPEMGVVLFAKDAKGAPIIDQKTKQQVPVVADHREYLDAETKKYKNGNWGKELKETIQRTGYFVVSDTKGVGHIMRVFGKYNPKMGYEHAIYGVMSEKGYITVPASGPGVTATRMMEDAEYFAAINNVAKTEDLAVNLAAILDMEKNKPFLSKGTVTHVSDGGTMVAIDDDGLQESIALFPDDDAIKGEVEKLSPGNEIIVMANTSDMDDKRNPGTKKRNGRLFGFACNPESDTIAANVSSLKDVMYT